MQASNPQRFKPLFITAPFANLFSTRVLEVTPTHVSYITGLLDKDERTVPISKITDVTVAQGCLGAVLGASNLSIQTSGSDNTEILFANMGKAREARDLILKYIAAAGK